jgi:hypothetical protein
LAHHATIVGLNVDTYRLFTSENQQYALWLSTLVEMVNETNRQQSGS